MSTQTAKTQDVTSITPDEITTWLFERSSDPKDLEQLAEDMAEGQAESISIRPLDEGYQGVTGYRRVKAVDQYGQDYGIEAIRAEIRDMSKFEAIQARIHSNLDRRDDTIYDQGQLCAMVAEELDDPTNSDISEIVGRSSTWVSKALNALDHPPDVKEAVESGAVSQNTASALAQEPDPDVRERAIERAEADQSPEEAQKEALQEARLEAGHAADAAGELNRFRDFLDRYQDGQERLEEAQETREEIAELRAERDDIWDNAPMQAQERYNQFKQAQAELEAVEEAQELVDNWADQLREEADSIRPSEEAETRLETWKNQVRDIESQIGDPTVTATEKKNEDISVQINVTFDPDDPPELLGEFMELYHDLQEAQADIEDLSSRMTRAETLKQRATDAKANPGLVQEHYPDFPSLDENVRQVFIDYSDDSLEAVRESLEETVQEANESELEEALEALEEQRERVDEIDSQIAGLKADLPPQGEEGRVNGYRNNAREALEQAREHFSELEEELQDAKMDAWADQYDDSALAYISGDGEMPEALQEPSGDGVEIDIEQNGSWYTLTANGEELKVQGEDSMEEAREAWESDGFEAAEATTG